MARSVIPDPLKRRHWLEGELSPERARAVAEAYLAEGRDAESLAFLAKAGASERLEEVLAEAVAAGDVFLVREGSKLLGRDVDASTWHSVAAGAAAAGKDHYAHEARRLAAAVEG